MKIEFIPTSDQTFEITGVDFSDILTRSDNAENRGDYKGAVELRWAAFQRLIEALPDEAIELDWDDENSQAFIDLGYRTGIDHFLASDWELAAAIFEQILELDPEDHLDATTLLTYCYVAMNEWELYDEVVQDIGDKSVDKVILELWSDWRRNGKISEGELRYFRTRFAPFYAEFIATEHPVDENYLRDIRSEQPSQSALAREKWLRAEHLWTQDNGFIEALK